MRQIERAQVTVENLRPQRIEPIQQFAEIP